MVIVSHRGVIHDLMVFQYVSMVSPNLQWMSYFWQETYEDYEGYEEQIGILLTTVRNPNHAHSPAMLHKDKENLLMIVPNLSPEIQMSFSAFASAFALHHCTHSNLGDISGLQ